MPLDGEGRFQPTVLPSLWLKPDWLREEELPTALELLRVIASQIFRAPMINS